ncbi:hypothetical protein GCM10009591_36790 [Brachybacterium tyrofermentans]
MECPLPGVVVDVEHASLSAGVSAGFQLEHRSLDPSGVQDTGCGQAAETATDDGDREMR